MLANNEQALIDAGGIKLSCDQPSKVKCKGCGDTTQSAESWARNGDVCQECGGSEHVIVCARCESVLDAPPLGEHPCHSLDLYRRTKAVVFSEEMLGAKERAHAGERTRAVDVLLEAERNNLLEQARISREARERVTRATRDRAATDRTERERIARERAEHERTDSASRLEVDALRDHMKELENRLAASENERRLASEGTPVLSSSEKTPKRYVACLLALFLGFLGVHKFYLGKRKQGFIMLATYILGSFLVVPALLVAVVSWIECICYISKSKLEFQRVYITDGRNWF